MSREIPKPPKTWKGKRDAEWVQLYIYERGKWRWYDGPYSMDRAFARLWEAVEWVKENRGPGRDEQEIRLELRETSGPRPDRVWVRVAVRWPKPEPVVVLDRVQIQTVTEMRRWRMEYELAKKRVEREEDV